MACHKVLSRARNGAVSDKWLRPRPRRARRASATCGELLDPAQTAAVCRKLCVPVGDAGWAPWLVTKCCLWRRMEQFVTSGGGRDRAERGGRAQLAANCSIARKLQQFAASCACRAGAMACHKVLPSAPNGAVCDTWLRPRPRRARRASATCGELLDRAQTAAVCRKLRVPVGDAGRAPWLVTKCCLWRRMEQFVTSCGGRDRAERGGRAQLAANCSIARKLEQFAASCVCRSRRRERPYASARAASAGPETQPLASRCATSWRTSGITCRPNSVASSRKSS